MNWLRHLFHFLGGILLAIFLILTAAIFVIVGTFIESKSGSHQLAAQWIYRHPLFFLLLFLFFINILVSALRRWPFKIKHIPFLITHIGLLMIIGGTIIKNWKGLQGLLFIWEGSGNNKVVLPFTYALYIESKEDKGDKKTTTVPLNSFNPAVIYPLQHPNLKCKLIGYAPHVKEKMETWIKGSKTHIAGFPSIDVQNWDSSIGFPEAKIVRSTIDNRDWYMIALRTEDAEAAIREAYLQNLTLKIKQKQQPDYEIEISAKKALENPFSIPGGEIRTSLHFSSLLQDKSIPFFSIKWISASGLLLEEIELPLQGSDALLLKPGPTQWNESSFIIDLYRPKCKLTLIQDHLDHVYLFAFDRSGRIIGEHFSPHQLNTLVSYDDGFGGYGTLMTIPYPNFPIGRADKEKAAEEELIGELGKIFLQPANLAPPLQFFKEACQKANVDFAKTFVEFLIDWNRSPGFLYKSTEPIPKTVQKVVNQFNWNGIAHIDQQGILWTNQILLLLEASLNKGENLLTSLEEHRWPLLSDLKKAKTGSHASTLAHQILSLSDYFPPLEFTVPQSVRDKVQMLSAFFRMYRIDYRSFFPFQNHEHEQFESLKNYWKSHSNNKNLVKEEIVLESPVLHQLIPTEPPMKLEDHQPGIVIEVESGSKKQMIALAYDPSLQAVKWPVLNGKYMLRFQPQQYELPYRIRLKEARQIPYPQTSQIYSYESDILITPKNKNHNSLREVLSMNHIYETWDGFRFYLSSVGTSANSGIKHIQLAVNYDPAKYILTYPGAVLVFLGTILLFWIFPYWMTK